MLIIGIVFAEALTLILSRYAIRKKFGQFSPQFQFSVWWNFLSRSAPIGMGVIFSVLYFRLDVVMLQLMVDEKVVGFYSAAYKLFEVVVVLPHSLMIVLFPSLVEEFHTDQRKFIITFKRAFAVYFVVGSSIALVFFSFSNEIVGLIYGEAFLFSIEILEILAIAIALSFSIFLLSNILIVAGQEMTNAWSLVGATVLNIFLNLAWIPVHGALGAAWATVVCEMALVLMLGFKSRKYWKPI
jgi:O-antigen/teichoic acid export membrane protein